jgi:hypothetical protein
MINTRNLLIQLVSFLILSGIFVFYTHPAFATLTATVKVDQNALGFRIPNLADILTFIIRAFFVIAGLAALFFLLLGAFGWVTSGGDEEAVGAARSKITAAVIGVILIVVVLAIIVTLEQIVFRGRICFGLSCAATIPNLVEPCGQPGEQPCEP